MRLKMLSRVKKVNLTLKRGTLADERRVKHPVIVGASTSKEQISQNLSINIKLRREECADRLRIKLGVGKRTPSWKLDGLVDTDSSGKLNPE